MVHSESEELKYKNDLQVTICSALKETITEKWAKITSDLLERLIESKTGLVSPDTEPVQETVVVLT